MAKKNKLPQKTDTQIQMARELGMNPKKFGSLANHKQERWKAPLPEFIEEIYLKRFGRSFPEKVRSIEQLVKERAKKKEERKMGPQERTHTDQVEDEPSEIPF